MSDKQDSNESEALKTIRLMTALIQKVNQIRLLGLAGAICALVGIFYQLSSVIGDGSASSSSETLTALLGAGVAVISGVALNLSSALGFNLSEFAKDGIDRMLAYLQGERDAKNP